MFLIPSKKCAVITLASIYLIICLHFSYKNLFYWRRDSLIYSKMNLVRYQNWQWLLFHSVKRLQLFTVPCDDTPVILMIFYYSDETAVAVDLVTYKKHFFKSFLLSLQQKRLFGMTILHSIEVFFDLKYPQWVLWILKKYISTLTFLPSKNISCSGIVLEFDIQTFILIFTLVFFNYLKWRLIRKISINRTNFIHHLLDWPSVVTRNNHVNVKNHLSVHLDFGV